MSGPRQLRVVSLIRSQASWAHVARRLCLSLVAAGVDVGIEESDERAADPAVPVPPALWDRVAPRVAAPADLVFVEPADYGRVLRGDRRYGFLVWEASHWPQAWVDCARAHLDGVMVPSWFCARSLVASGFPRERVAVIPHGVDPRVFRPVTGASEGGPVRELLFVGTPALRKGLDLLLAALPRAFSPREAPRLTLKTSRWPRRPDAYNDWERDVRALRARGYQIAVRTDAVDDTQMARLYRSADLLVLPHRGEGFGLPLLEAMACGTAVLTTGWSAPMDYLDGSVAYLLTRLRERPAGPLIPERFGAPAHALVVEPDLDELVATLRHACADTASHDRRALGVACARDLTWDSAAMETAAALGLPAIQLAATP